MGHQKQLGHRLGNALPHSHCLYSDPPRTSCVLNPQASVGGGEGSGKGQMGQEEVRLLNWRPSTFRLYLVRGLATQASSRLTTQF